jgi:hypothetical protein
MLQGDKDMGATIPDRPELHIAIGAPAGEPQAIAGTKAWKREYAHGLAVVNPSKTRSATLDLGMSPYTDLQGKTVRGTISIPPATGMVLLKASLK